MCLNSYKRVKCLSHHTRVAWVTFVLVMKQRSPACVTLVLKALLISSVNSSAPHTCLPLAILVCISCFTARLLQSYAPRLPAGCHFGDAAELRRASAMVRGCACFVLTVCGRLLSKSETSFHFFTFGHLGRLAFELVAQTAFFFFSPPSGNSASRTGVCFC